MIKSGAMENTGERERERVLMENERERERDGVTCNDVFPVHNIYT